MKLFSKVASVLVAILYLEKGRNFLINMVCDITERILYQYL